MKLPALWIAAAFAAGIGVTLRWPASLPECAAATVAAIVAGRVLLWLDRTPLMAAWALALVAWIGLGALAATMERAMVPANHVTRLLASGLIDTSVALRWRGRLREDPLVEKWGRRYEISLDGVVSGGATLAASGGMRVNFYEHAEEKRKPEAVGVPEGLRAGDLVEALVRARPPRNFLDPGAFDLRGYLGRQKIDLQGSLRSAELLRLVERGTPTMRERLARARGDLLARLDALFVGQPERAAVLRAMLLGDRSFVDSDVVTAFQKTAAYHVLVVAGLHVGALAVFFYWLGRRMRLSVVATMIMTLLSLAAYVGMVQDRPPILRAALMAGLYLCARPLFRRVDLLNTVAIAALALLIWSPSSLTDSSFQLSFLAAGVIAGLALPWMERTSVAYRRGVEHLGDVTRDIAHPPKVIQFRIEMRALGKWIAARLPRYLAPRAEEVVVAPIRLGLRLWDIVLLSVVIQWGMMSLLAQDFHRVSLAGPLSNIPAVILTGLIVPLGFLTLIASFIWARLAVAFAKALGLCAGLLLSVVGWFSRLPHVSYRIPGPPAWLMAAFFTVLIILAAAARSAASKRAGRISRRQLAPPIHAAEWISGVALAGLTLIVATHPFAPRLEGGKLEVSVLDVGQGDSIFTAFPGGRTMLIDGGGQAGAAWVGGQRTGIDIGEEVVSPYLWSRGLKRLDVVALTHAHQDHVDGLRAVLENFRVGELWIGREEQTTALEALEAEARRQGVKVVHRTGGEKFNWDGVEEDVLWPEDASPAPAAANDDSLVLRLEDGAVRFLLAGDIEKKVEADLVSAHAALGADFLKVPHHGSKTSSTEGFVTAVAPRVAVISVGEANPFGHPAEAVVERYDAAGVRVLRTDRDGAVTATTDGASLVVHTFAEAHPR